jgi:hypothetical protein
VTAVVAVAAVVLLIVIGLVAYTRRPRQDAGLTSFRRHIDALSPESRREVMDRVRPSQQSGADSGVDSGAGSRADDIDEASRADPQEPTD